MQVCFLSFQKINLYFHSQIFKTQQNISNIMTLRAVNQIVVHLETFRNIELWYQGIYFLSIEIIYQQQLQNGQSVNAHPFAHTENFHPNDQSKRYYDHQVVKTSYIDDFGSRFISKHFIVKYYQQEIELNDISHFRIETNLYDPNPQIILVTNLHFVDLAQKKSFDKMEEREKQQLFRQAKIVKTKKFYLSNSLQGIHEFVPLIFDENYFSLINMSVHSVCLDYRFRTSSLQMSQFSRLSYNEKLKMIEANNRQFIESNGPGGKKKLFSFYNSITKDLGLEQKPSFTSLKIIENLLINDLKLNYGIFLQKYSNLFSKVITENERKLFGSRLTNPNSLYNFQEQSLIVQSKNTPLEQEQLLAKYRTTNPEQIIDKILEETNFISAQYMKLWACYIDLFKISPRFSIAYLQSEYHSKKKEFWSKLLYKNKVIGKDIYQGYTEGLKEIEKNLLLERTKTNLGLSVQEEELIQRRQQLPVLIENIHYLDDDPQIKQKKEKNYKLQKPNQSERESEGIHLIVFVHGFQGNSFDMRLIKNYVSFLYPQSMFLCATSNEELTDNDIFQMGERLANEIKSFIIENFPQNSLSKLSFIGHSLGGVKIRAALPKLLEYRQKFFCFMSFSSPHLGYGINTSSVVEAGMWVLQKMKNSICLKQLSMSDNQVPEETCLYKLSQTEGLQYFKHIFLFSSKQDSYAPFQSARMQIASQFIGDKSKQIHCRMVRNLLRHVKSGVLRRINVVFQIGKNNLDSLIGRTAHILFLENQELMKAILYTEPELLA